MKTKRICAVALVVSIGLCMVGCGSDTQVSLEDVNWQLATVQSATDGAVVACSDAYEDNCPDAEQVNFSCTAADGVITITNRATGEAYTGSYSLETANVESAIYQIWFGDDSGHAATAYTEYLDQEKQPTLTVSIGDYGLYFFEQSGE